jgi:hypothetical protein
MKCNTCKKEIMSSEEWENDEVPIGTITIIKQVSFEVKDLKYFCSSKCFNKWRKNESNKR